MHHILCGCFDGNEKHNNKNIKKYFKNIKNIFKTFIKNICQHFTSMFWVS